MSFYIEQDWKGCAFSLKTTRKFDMADKIYTWWQIWWLLANDLQSCERFDKILQDSARFYKYSQDPARLWQNLLESSLYHLNDSYFWIKRWNQRQRQVLNWETARNSSSSKNTWQYLIQTALEYLSSRDFTVASYLCLLFSWKLKNKQKTIFCNFSIVNDEKGDNNDNCRIKRRQVVATLLVVSQDYICCCRCRAFQLLEPLGLWYQSIHHCYIIN
jgi:hypothetical protein